MKKAIEQKNIHLLQPSLSPSKPHEKYRNIIFDLGAVLIYWNPEAIIRDMFKHEKEIPFNLLDLVKTSEWLEVDRGTLTGDDLVTLFSSHFNPHHLCKFVYEHKQYLKPLEDGIKILQAIKAQGYNTYVISNMGSENFEYIYEQYQFLHDFDGMIISYQVQTVKPEPAIYQKLLQTYSLNPEECFFIDDMDVNIQAAQNLGIDGVICKNHDLVLQELKRLNVLK